MTDTDVDRIAEIERLAALEPIDYEAARERAAKRLGIRASVLDAEVKRTRRALGLEKKAEAEGQGTAVKINDPLPWHEPVGGDLLATALSIAIRQHIVLRDEEADAIAIWILHTWLVNEFQFAPRLAIYSPTKGCGKTTLLGVLSKLVRRAKFAGSLTAPVLFRLVELHQPTLLIDELNKFLEAGTELHGILNEGHGKGVNVFRVIGDQHELREFKVYASLAFGTLGRLPDDLEDRSIIVELQRRLAGDHIEPFRIDRAEHLDRLARMCARWAEDHTIYVRETDAETPGLLNRTADNWRPLFAIASVIAADWPERIAAAAARLTRRDDQSTGIRLLADIRAIFDTQKTDRLSSAEICEALAAIEGARWADWKAGKPITPNQLARQLRPFAIVSGTIRTSAGTPKGYQLHQFAEAFERYLGPDGVSEAPQRHNADGSSTSGTFRNATPESVLRFENDRKPLRHNDCGVVAVQTPLCAWCGRDEGELLAASEAGREIHLHRFCLDGWTASREAAE